MIESRGFYITEKEVRWLLNKLDRNRDGKVTFNEVSNV